MKLNIRHSCYQDYNKILSLGEKPRQIYKTLSNFLGAMAAPLQSMAFFDKILSVHEQKVRCVSMHLISGVLLQCLLDLWLRKYNQLIYFLFFLALKGVVWNSMHVSGSIFTSLLSL